MDSRPESLSLAWYGDDFTGAAAVLEVLTFAGIPAMLFLDAPTPEQLSRFPELRAFGIASTARAHSPDWMERNLPPAFEALLALEPEILHYKVCSTLDSSPTTGSIGRAIEIAAKIMAPEMVPVLVAAPQLRRYQIFGHLFAGHGDKVYRLDRHPVMARHPVTPMQEADVGKHLSAQSDRLSVSVWPQDKNAARSEASQGQISVCTLDCMDPQSEAEAGQFIWENRRKNRFVVGSQGIEYAIVNHWIKTNQLPPPPPRSGVGRASGMVSVSGSVSPTTAEQIAWSRANGFAPIHFDASQACLGSESLTREIERAVYDSLSAITDGLDPLIYTAHGPDDPNVARFRQAAARSGKPITEVNQSIGKSLGTVLDRVLTQSGIRRAVVSGGDTSGYAAQQLGIFALTALAPTIPGASLCLAHADGPMDGLELALKGGQMGSPDYFGWIRDGGGPK
ncbi:four-carbon acid sugar kinase family protein [uncultured Pelagimonas sp.]|uniref:four-carbon acid sugar kinase family protein n=1 Tax=uncultured Pelagimonas sp. TaxID=1618102 RepID=UPI002632B8D3|nr:four-carbon acid sugar kinase family protein [uncultured Pelagimonas sp.]